MTERTFVINYIMYTVDLTPHLKKKGLVNITKSIQKSLNIPRTIKSPEQVFEIIWNDLVEFSKENKE